MPMTPAGTGLADIKLFFFESIIVRLGVQNPTYHFASVRYVMLYLLLCGFDIL